MGGALAPGGELPPLAHMALVTPSSRRQRPRTVSNDAHDRPAFLPSVDSSVEPAAAHSRAVNFASVTTLVGAQAPAEPVSAAASMSTVLLPDPVGRETTSAAAVVVTTSTCDLQSGIEAPAQTVRMADTISFTSQASLNTSPAKASCASACIMLGGRRRLTSGPDIGRLESGNGLEAGHLSATHSMAAGADVIDRKVLGVCQGTAAAPARPQCRSTRMGQPADIQLDVSPSGAWLVVSPDGARTPLVQHRPKTPGATCLRDGDECRLL